MGEVSLDGPSRRIVCEPIETEAKREPERAPEPEPRRIMHEPAAETKPARP
jgi:hypothetical protein